MEPLDKPRVPQAQTANNIGAGPRPVSRQPYSAPFGGDSTPSNLLPGQASLDRYNREKPNSVMNQATAMSQPSSTTPASTGPQPFAAPQQRSTDEYNKNNPYSIMNQVTAMQKPAEFKKEFMDSAPGAQGAYTSPFSENEQGQNSVLSTPNRQYDFGKTSDWLDWLKETNPGEYDAALDRFDPQASFAAAQERRNLLRKENNRALGVANGLSLLYGPSRASELGIM